MNMMDKKFAEKIGKLALDHDFKLYLDWLTKTPIEKVLDFRWKRLIELYRKMDDLQKEAFQQVMKLMIINTISTIFGIIDGINILDDFKKGFTLMYEKEKINGDLQDYFLASQEV